MNIDSQNTTSPQIAFTAAMAKPLVLWGYPLLEVLRTCQVQSNPQATPAFGRGPFGSFHGSERPWTHEDRDIVTPSCDLLYYNAWVWIGDSPVRLHIPPNNGRYYVVQLLDAWSENFHNVGLRNTPAEGADWWLINTEDPMPAGINPSRVVRCPTRLVWLLGRALVGNTNDVSDAKRFADGVQLHGSGPRPPCVSLWHDSGNTADDFFHNLLQAVDEIGVPSNASDMRPLMRSLRLPPGRLDALEQSSQRLRDGLRQAHAEGMHLIEQHTFNLTRKPWTWSPHLGIWGDNILMRATVAMKGLGALAATETIYAQADFDANSEPLNGQHAYTLRFEGGYMPPAEAFWSVSLYGEDRYFAANTIGRYAIGDRTQGLRRNEDNSLTLKIQHERPAEGDANWLPAPSGAFYLILRMYHPREEMLRGQYVLPPLQLVNKS